MTTWADVAKGDRIVSGGRKYEVAKIKSKGKRAAIKLRDKHGVYDGVVKLKERVELVPLHDSTGAQTRGASKGEGEAIGDVWDTPATKVEKRLDRLLGATLIGEMVDEGWYVPTVDVSTIAAHLLVFHNTIVGAVDGEPPDLMQLHRDAHKAANAEPFEPLHVVHEHAERRP